ncbi:glycosyltransferase family 2 protein [Ochrobactrum soli]|uniref:Glycosyltransferase family 2 protein n=1 Tax=Ochrobactrum soli TaxID=2448455 RepID=A0A849KS09_9HYPH|nr:glycosyltransferase family 2 protein [[Ochrobactrum] soli]NNU60134.1 glycosyltransferase family 2 protein [[Ochrobactrum] soli]
MSKKPNITVIVPVMNEEESIPLFLSEFFLRTDTVAADFDFLFIDDGSTDGTIKVLQAAHVRDARVNFIKLSRNFGKEAAMTAGIDHVTTDAAIIMDVDLQDPPEIISEMVRLWQAGYDTVFGMRVSRLEDTRAKRVTAQMFYKLFNASSHINIPNDVGDFRLISRRVIDALKLLPERNRFMKGLFAWPGYSSVGVPYERPARTVGSTKFNFWKLWNFALDGITSFSTWPLRIWTYVGATVAAISLLYMVFIIMKTIIFGADWPGYASIMSAILFLGSLQLISVGILGEYIGRMYIETKKRPTYVIDSKSFSETKDV